MARRPVFVPLVEGPAFVKEIMVDFTWVPGMAESQKRKNVLSLHLAALKMGVEPVLEISTKSQKNLGEMLSAFNLKLNTSELRFIPVEAAFQGSKVFKSGGPYREFYRMTGREIRRDERLRNSGDLLRFDFVGDMWGLEPKTAFYDWLYLTALSQNPNLSSQLLEYRGFTDIEFNPEKSINCQARSAALFVALSKRNFLEKALLSKEDYLETIAAKHTPNQQPRNNEQLKLFSE